jgi:glycosyltransferase involved in cell wall biosynthesis
LRVLAITNEFPLPLDRGGPIRFFGLARALAEHHDVHMLALRRPSTTDELVDELSSALRGPVEVFDRQGAGSGDPVAVTGRWTRALRRGVPPWVAAQHSPRLGRRVAELAPAMDVVAILDDYAAIYAQVAAPHAPVVSDKSNVMGWTAARDGFGPRRLQRELGVRLLRRFEAACLAHSSAVVVTSPEEGERLEALYAHRPDAVVPSAVDLPEPPVEPAGPAVGWLGSHEYVPNVEGLVRFGEEAWEPLGRAGMRLLVAGGDPPDPVRRLERLPGVELLGYVDDLREFSARLGAAVVPLWHGAGVKLKTLTFMAAGVPVAGTPVALEGIEAESGRHCLAADDPGGLAKALVRLVEEPSMARRVGAEGRRLVAENYTWERVGPRFVEAVERAATTRS